MSTKRRGAAPATPPPRAPAADAAPTNNKALDLLREVVATEPNEGRRNGPAASPGKVPSFKQAQVLQSAGLGHLSEQEVWEKRTYPDMNRAIAEAKAYIGAFQQANGARPCSVWLYQHAAALNDALPAAQRKRMPAPELATQPAVMAIWMELSSGIRADVASELIYSYGLPSAEVYGLSYNQSAKLLETLTAARADGTLPAADLAEVNAKRSAQAAGLADGPAAAHRRKANDDDEEMA